MLEPWRIFKITVGHEMVGRVPTTCAYWSSARPSHSNGIICHSPAERSSNGGDWVNWLSAASAPHVAMLQAADIGVIGVSGCFAAASKSSSSGFISNSVSPPHGSFASTVVTSDGSSSSVVAAGETLSVVCTAVETDSGGVKGAEQYEDTDEVLPLLSEAYVSWGSRSSVCVCFSILC